MASFGYTLRKAWRKKRDDIRQAKYTHEHDVLFRRKGKEKALFVVAFIILVIFVISFIFPFAWILMNSFKETSEFGLNMMGWPKNFTFDNFANAFTFKDSTTQNKTILEMLAMTILIAGVGTLVTVFTSTSAAYVVSKYKFFGRNIIFSVVIFSLIVPILQCCYLLTYRPYRWFLTISNANDEKCFTFRWHSYWLYLYLFWWFWRKLLAPLFILQESLLDICRGR